MLKILVANNNTTEGKTWRDRLLSDGYHVTPLCPDLNALLRTLDSENIHIIVCGANLINHNAFAVLSAILDWYPRTKIVVVGRMADDYKAKILNNLSDVVIRPMFGTDLERYWKIPVFDAEFDGLPLLLDEHFLSYDEAALLLQRIMPKWVSGYAVIAVAIEGHCSEAMAIITAITEEHKIGHAVGLKSGEICIVMDNSPTEEACFQLANAVRRELLKKTGVSFSIGLSRVRNTAAMLYVCRKEALRATSAKYIYGQNNVVHINYICENDLEYVYPEHKEKRLIERVMDGDKETALKLLDEIFDVIRKQNIVHQSVINKIGLSIMIRMNIAAISRAKILEQTQAEAMTGGKLLAAKTTEDVYIFLKAGIVQFADEIEALNDLRRDALYVRLSQMKAAGDNISIADLTQIYRTTISFLNSAIIRNTDSNIFDFITK
jgi:hypothetical protein